MKRPLRAGLVLLGAAGGIALLAGCSSVSKETPAATTRPKDPLHALQRGMDAQAVRDIMGAPESTRTSQADGATVDIWTYTRDLDVRVDMIAPTVDQVPWVDPVTGVLVYIREPAQTPQTTRRSEEITLFFLNGQLAELRRAIHEQSSISRH